MIDKKKLLKCQELIGNKDVGGFKKWMYNVAAMQVCTTKSVQVLQNHGNKMSFYLCLLHIEWLLLYRIQLEKEKKLKRIFKLY